MLVDSREASDLQQQVQEANMRKLSPDDAVRKYFEGRVRVYSPAIRCVILEDVDLLLEGKPASFIEGLEDLREETLQVCDLFGVKLSAPIP